VRVPQPSERRRRAATSGSICFAASRTGHLPNNVVNWITTRNYGFSDAAEIFVFISCYTAVLVYERVMRRHGFQPACARKFQRGIGRPDEQALRQCLSPMRGV
jgi:hypothetical protein